MTGAPAGAGPRAPDFIIAGERRAGTTTVYEAMARHPGVGLLEPADVNYFTDDLFVGVRSWDDRPLVEADWDENHSVADYTARFAGIGGDAIGHKGADLLFWTPAHERIMRLVPDVKLVVVLREPASRAASHFLNEVAKGRETLPFSVALASEQDRARLSPYAHFHYSYRERGRYAESLTRLYATVPAAQVHVVVFEELVRDPRERLNEIFAFVGADRLEQPELPHTNANAALQVRPAFRRPPLARVATFNKRATDAVVRRAVHNHDDKTMWRRRLNAPTHTVLTRADLVDEIAALKADYADEGAKLSEVLGREVTAW